MEFEYYVPEVGDVVEILDVRGYDEQLLNTFGVVREVAEDPFLFETSPLPLMVCVEPQDMPDQFFWFYPSQVKIKAISIKVD